MKLLFESVLSQNVVKIALLLCALASTASASALLQQAFKAEGISVEFQLQEAPKSDKSSNGNPVTALIRLNADTIGKPIARLNPKAWLSLRRSEQVATETSCEAKVKSFASGQLATRADVDLNSYLLLTLNQDKTVAFINPHVASGNKLEGIVQLPTQGLDWALTKDGKWLYVTMPEVSSVALIDTASHSLVNTITMGANSKPTRIVLAPDEQSVWVGLDGSPTVAVIQRGEQPQTKTVNVGEGLHQIAFTPDNRFAVVTNTAANTISVIDSLSLKKLGDLKVGSTPLKAVWGEKAERFYVVSVNDAYLSVIDLAELKVDSQINVGRGNMDVAVDPQGRYLWVVNQLEAKVDVIDTATNHKIATAKVPNEPDQVAFTADYAYIRSLGSEKFTLINRQQLDKIASQTIANDNKIVELSTTQIQAGEKPPSFLSDAIGVADMIAPLPEQNSVMVASAPGKTLYYYVEGMMVPMGTLDNYRRIPRGLLVLDRSLKESSPGVFTAPVNIEKSGNYDVALMIDQPRIIHCFTAKLEGNAIKSEQSQKTSVKLEFLPLPAPLLANTETLIRFKLIDAESGKPVLGIQDARLLVFEPPGLWQKREWLQEVSEGIYQATVNFPHSGRFDLLVEANSKGLAFIDQSLSSIKIDGSIENKTAINETHN